MSAVRLPELLAPAGDRASLDAAIRNGADAVYFGARAFNARVRAGNFDADALRDAVAEARLRGVRPYLTLNTLLLDGELDAAAELATEAYEAGIAACIVQDLGLARRLRRLLPDLPLHASTQATVADADAVRAAVGLGFSRIILPRELSLPEIADFARTARESGAGVEVFVHGALCYCFSGQCRMSSLLGGRSGNRGECAQPCRLAYSLERVAGTEREDAARPSSAPARPLLSPKDLSALRFLPELVEAGVEAVKIEGRMRSAAYVGQAVAVFRRRLDAIAAQGTSWRPDAAEEAEDRRRLLLAFNRGGAFTDDYLRGAKGPAMLAGAVAGSHGVRLGAVLRAVPASGVLEIRLDGTAADVPGAGDVLSVRDPGGGEEKASAPCTPAGPARGGADGAAVLSVRGFHPDVLRTRREGDPVHRMNDAAAERAALAVEARRTPFEADFSQDEDGRFRLEVRVATPDPAAPPVRAAAVEEMPRDGGLPALDPVRLREQLARTGATPFRLATLDVRAAASLPVSAVNALRREALERLEATLRASFRRIRPQPAALEGPAASKPSASATSADAAPFRIAVEYWRPGEEPAEALACGADEYRFPAAFWLSPDGPERIRALKELEPGAVVAAVLPAAARGDFARRVAAVPPLVAEAGGGCVVTGGPGTAARAAALGLQAVAGPDANLWNQEAASVFREAGADAAVPSVELTASEMARFCRGTAAEGLPAEPVVYGRQRLMHAELCPVGHNRPGCSLCRRHDYVLRDRTGAAFPAVCNPDGCSASILNAALLSIPREAVALRAEGVRRLSLLFLDETPAERRDLVDLHRRLTGTDAAERARAAASAVARRVGIRLTRGAPRD